MQYEQDRAREERTRADIEYLTRAIAAVRLALAAAATRDFVRLQLQRMVEEVGEPWGFGDGGRCVRPTP